MVSFLLSGKPIKAINYKIKNKGKLQKLQDAAFFQP